MEKREPAQLLDEVFEFRQDEGLIRLHDQRVVILSAAAMGLLRKEILQTLGTETARRLLGLHEHLTGCRPPTWEKRTVSLAATSSCPGSSFC